MDLTERYQTQLAIGGRALAAVGRTGKVRIIKKPHTSDTGQSVVLRCEIGGAGTPIDGVIVKQILARKFSDAEAELRFDRERAALSWLSGAGTDLRPRIDCVRSSGAARGTRGHSWGD